MEAEPKAETSGRGRRASGKTLKFDRRNHRQRPEGPDHQLAHVESCDVLDYHAAGTDELAVQAWRSACLSTMSRAVP